MILKIILVTLRKFHFLKQIPNFDGKFLDDTLQVHNLTVNFSHVQNALRWNLLVFPIYLV